MVPIECRFCRSMLGVEKDTPGSVVICAQCGNRFTIPVPVKSKARKPIVVASQDRAARRMPTARPVHVAPQLPGPVEMYLEATPAQEPARQNPAFVTAEPMGKQKKSKVKLKRRYRKPVSSNWVGVAVAVGILVILVGVGAFFGIGKFGWIKGNSLVKFNDQVVSVFDRIEKQATQLERNQARMMLDPSQAINAIRQMRAPVQAGVVELTRMTVPSEGKEFHDAAVKLLTRMDRFIGIDMEQALKSGDERQGEDLVARAVDELTTLENALEKAQEEMASRNNFRLDRRYQRRMGGRPW